MTEIVAGDIGGTKTVLSVYEAEGDQFREVRKQIFPSGEYSNFNELVHEFLGVDKGFAAACFGIAGPVSGSFGKQRCVTTNLPWEIDAVELESEGWFQSVRLLNDLEAAAYGMLHLGEDELVELNPQAKSQPGHSAVIAAGTGLGQAILYFDGNQHHAMPTEGGHCDFAAQNSQEDALLHYLRTKLNGHVSYERILCGDGFGTLYDFLKQSDFAEPNPAIETEMHGQDRNEVVTKYGLTASDPLCTEAVRMFCRIYGAEAGNLALKSLPLGGLFVGGGIGPKIRTALESGDFIQSYLEKGRLSRAIDTIPVRLALNPETPLLGAVHQAIELLDDG